MVNKKNTKRKSLGKLSSRSRRRRVVNFSNASSSDEGLEPEKPQTSVVNSRCSSPKVSRRASSSSSSRDSSPSRDSTSIEDLVRDLDSTVLSNDETTCVQNIVDRIGAGEEAS